MCVSPITLEDGTQVSCSRCNKCLAARIDTWTARACAEASCKRHVFALTLTYGDQTAAGASGAQVFHYSHVQSFLKKLRRRAEKAFSKEKAQSLSFICCGELGSKNERVHWHMLIFADFDITQIGVFLDRHDKQKSGRTLITPNPVPGERNKPKARNWRWDLWATSQGHLGFVVVQIPEQAGMRYVLKYAVKDYFSEARSRGTERETNSSRVAAGCFRMSRRPGIGEEYLSKRIAWFQERGQVPPNLKVPVPGYSGYWYPTGDYRRWYIDSLRAIALDVYDTRGQYPPQWRALLASAATGDRNTDLERLNGEFEEEEAETAREIVAAAARAGRENSARNRAFAIRTKCGRAEPCERCARFQNGAAQFVEEYRARGGKNPYTGRVNPFCYKRGFPSHYQAFFLGEVQEEDWRGPGSERFS